MSTNRKSDLKGFDNATCGEMNESLRVIEIALFNRGMSPQKEWARLRSSREPGLGDKIAQIFGQNNNDATLYWRQALSAFSAKGFFDPKDWILIDATLEKRVDEELQPNSPTPWSTNLLCSSTSGFFTPEGYDRIRDNHFLYYLPKCLSIANSIFAVPKKNIAPIELVGDESRMVWFERSDTNDQDYSWCLLPMYAKITLFDLDDGDVKSQLYRCPRDYKIASARETITYMVTYITKNQDFPLLGYTFVCSDSYNPGGHVLISVNKIRSKFQINWGLETEMDREKRIFSLIRKYPDFYPNPA